MVLPSTIKDSSDVATIVLRARKLQGMTQSDLAGSCGIGTRFIVDLEKGKSTCQLGKVLLVLEMLGVRLEASEPGRGLEVMDV